MIKIKWLGHACYKIYFDDIQCVIDPFEKGYVPGYRDISTSADIILASHNHNDHCGLNEVQQLLRMVHGVTVTKVDTFHDDKNGALRGKNIVHVLEYNGIKVAHFGDIGHVLTEEQVQQIGNVDVAIVPIGGTYTVRAPEAKTICEQVNAKVIIPMHYRTDEQGFDVLETTEEFENLFDNVKHYDSDEYVVPEEIVSEVAILTYK
ncbi:MAG: MBL fold metallo-hydrolase [Oscillospiraceae bacterium]|nr:MBL fold metallo-hydrolase [Oscillospiraceae bacterium]MBP1571614.1 MBL fold metallo-hydrolase [Oscillospiraceae bacterium]